MRELIGLDFETYGSVSLPEYGLDNYTKAPCFQPLLASVYWEEGGAPERRRFDFVHNYNGARSHLANILSDRNIAATNAGFELAVLRQMDLGRSFSETSFIDAAVVARAAGAAGKLEAAAPQLLGVDKLAQGKDLMKLFSMPGAYQEANGHPAFDPQVVRDNPVKWDLYGEYCDVDAELGFKLVNEFRDLQPIREIEFNHTTMEMNEAGWPVDLDLVRTMNERYKLNQQAALEDFIAEWDPKGELNLNSLKQLKEWCAARGVRATSFNEANVAKMLARLRVKIVTMRYTDPKFEGYVAVRDMLHTKQILGGSSLKKLDVILRNTGADGRLRDQYLHCGAGQTLRSSGRGAQLQNLKRLGEEPGDVAEVETWDNEELARNLRQVFTASDPNGALIVGDFSSVESRGLAYLAGENWKIDAFRAAKDLYKVLAEKIFSVSYNAVTKPQRQTGKVGELSCGYGAGAGAVVSFAEGMGVTMTEAEAAVLVMDWRAANPNIVSFWGELDDMLHQVVRGTSRSVTRRVANGEFQLTLCWARTPDSLLQQAPGVRSIEMKLVSKSDAVILRRYFHGCYVRGNSICFYKPSEILSGPLWKPTFVDPKTKQRKFFSLYGGKLAGILTQSFCREIFFWVLREVRRYVDLNDQLTLIGQFHDEIVVDWKPPEQGQSWTVEWCKNTLEKIMSDPGPFIGFPLAAEVKHDYRYTK